MPPKVLLRFGLTEREWEVLLLICKGYQDKKIAKQLVISVRTTYTHVENILTKLEVENRTEAAIKALQHDMFDLDEPAEAKPQIDEAERQLLEDLNKIFGSERDSLGDLSPCLLQSAQKFVEQVKRAGVFHSSSVTYDPDGSLAEETGHTYRVFNDGHSVKEVVEHTTNQMSTVEKPNERTTFRTDSLLEKELNSDTLIEYLEWKFPDRSPLENDYPYHTRMIFCDYIDTEKYPTLQHINDAVVATEHGRGERPRGDCPSMTLETDCVLEEFC